MHFAFDAVILSFVNFIMKVFLYDIFTNLLLFQMEEKVKLDHAFCAKFREDIERYGLKQVVRDLVVSTSAKVPLRKQYLARECNKKNSFKNQFVAACVELKNDRQIRPAVIALQQEIVTS